MGVYGGIIFFKLLTRITQVFSALKLKPHLNKIHQISFLGFFVEGCFVFWLLFLCFSFNCYFFVIFVSLFFCCFVFLFFVCLFVFSGSGFVFYLFLFF